MKLYGYPDVGRFGLGHSLLAWARCVVWCQKSGATMLAPHWFRLRVGPYLRRERDKRAYFRYFTDEGYLSDPLRTWVLLTGVRSTAPNPMASTREKWPSVLIFRNAHARNFETYFHEVKGHGPQLHEAFRRIVKPQYRPAPVRAPFIAIHVRLGDFSPFSERSVQAGAHNQRLPIYWYRDALVELRNKLGEIVEARVYSDGEDGELAPLLALPRVRRTAEAASVTHMLEMAQASAIIGAGSNFNLWPAFFGQVPRITYPNQAFVSANEERELDASFAPGQELPTNLVSAIRRGLTRFEKADVGGQFP